jgi:membrane-associated protein
MENIWEYLQNLTDAQSILSRGGFYLLLIVVLLKPVYFSVFFYQAIIFVFSRPFMQRQAKVSGAYLHISFIAYCIWRIR